MDPTDLMLEPNLHCTKSADKWLPAVSKCLIFKMSLVSNKTNSTAQIVLETLFNKRVIGD